MVGCLVLRLQEIDVFMPVLRRQPPWAIQHPIGRAGHMTPGARPPIALRTLGQPCLQRITFCHSPQVLIGIDKAQEEAVLPDSPRLFELAIKILGIDLIGQPDPARQSGFRFRYGQQMDMIVIFSIGLLHLDRNGVIEDSASRPV